MGKKADFLAMYGSGKVDAVYHEAQLLPVAKGQRF
jgi:hypothetical protein